MSKELKLFAKIEVRWYDKVVKRTSFVFRRWFSNWNCLVSTVTKKKNPKICHSLETAKKNLKIPAKWNSTVVEKDR